MKLEIVDWIKGSMKRFPLCIKAHDKISNLKLRNLVDLVLFPAAVINLLRLDYGDRQIIGGGYRLCAVAIIKNEGPYLKEWIEYHKQIVGVDHFYLYDNESNDDTFSVLKDYIEHGIVTYIHIKGPKRQHDAYNDALNKFSYKTTYMAFIDLLDDRISDNSRAGAVLVNWLLFGSSGLEKKTCGLVIDNYIWRAAYDFKTNRLCKTICNPRSTLAFVNAHYAIYKHGKYAVDNARNRVYGARCLPTEDGLKIYHYFTKSKEEFNAKRLRGKADDGKIRAERDFEEHDINDVLDYNLKNLGRKMIL